ncbi:MAG: hypothetical protein AAF710_03835 [Planctomycetota bacterium]
MSDEALSPIQTLRVIWGAVLMGLVTVMGVMVFLTLGGEPAEEAVNESGGLPIVSLIAAGLLITTIPAGYFVRNQVYKANWRGDAVTAEGYQKGNIVFYALIEFPAVVAAISVLVEGAVWPHLIPWLVTVGLLLVNFPTGGPTRDESPRLGADG